MRQSEQTQIHIMPTSKLPFPLVRLVGGLLMAIMAACAAPPAPPAPPQLPLPIAWQARLSNAINRPAVSDGLIFIVNERSQLVALDAATGAKRWEADLGQTNPSDDPVGADAGRVFAAVNGKAGKIVAFDSATGATLWTVALGNQLARDEHPIARDGLVYYEANSADGKTSVLRAADAATGETRWEAPVDTNLRTAPLIGDGLIYAGAYLWEDNTKKARRVIAFDVTTGEQRWDYTSDLDLSDRFALDGQRLYFGVDGGVVIARDAATGEPAWTARVGGTLSNSPVVADGVLYIGTTDGVLAALNAADGAPLWTADVKSSILSDVAAHDGVIYFGTNDGHLYAVDAQTGAMRWQARSPERRPLGLQPYVPAMSTTPVVAGDLLLYFNGDALYALKLK